jgi:hypothetical protein
MPDLDSCFASEDFLQRSHGTIGQHIFRLNKEVSHFALPSFTPGSSHLGPHGAVVVLEFLKPLRFDLQDKADGLHRSPLTKEFEIVALSGVGRQFPMLSPGHFA